MYLYQAKNRGWGTNFAPKLDWQPHPDDGGHLGNLCFQWRGTFSFIYETFLYFLCILDKNNKNESEVYIQDAKVVEWGRRGVTASSLCSVSNCTTWTKHHLAFTVMNCYKCALYTATGHWPQQTWRQLGLKTFTSHSAISLPRIYKTVPKRVGHVFLNLLSHLDLGSWAHLQFCIHGEKSPIDFSWIFLINLQSASVSVK